MGELSVVGRDIGKHVSHAVAHHWELLGSGPPPDTVCDVIDQQVQFVFVKVMA